MKKFLVLILAIVAIAGWADTPPDPIPLETHPNENSDDGKRFRSPARNLVEVFYDSVTGTVITTGDPNLDAEVYLYDETGMVEDYSACVNSTLHVTSRGSHTVIVIAEYWYAIGYFENAN